MSLPYLKSELPPAAPRKVSGAHGTHRWACRRCALSHPTRGAALACCDHAAVPPEPLPPGHRDHAEIIEQLDARMAELEQQARDRKEAPPSQWPCATCKWQHQIFSHCCAHPLVKGFDQDDPANVDWQLQRCTSFPSSNWPHTGLCGREKALWEPKAPSPPPLTRWQHLLKALFG